MTADLNQRDKAIFLCSTTKLNFVILIIFVLLPCAFFRLTLAANKDCYVFPWFLGGLFFGPLALIAIAGMPDRRTRKYIRLMAEKLEAIEPDK